jgi:hypothetical protein
MIRQHLSTAGSGFSWIHQIKNRPQVVETFRFDNTHAKIGFTIFPLTSVKRKSRP